jgi:hypothetical protein
VHNVTVWAYFLSLPPSSVGISLLFKYLGKQIHGKGVFDIKHLLCFFSIPDTKVKGI